MVDGLEGPLKAWFFWVWVLLVCWFGVGKNFDSSILLCDLNHYPSLLLLLFVWGFCPNCSLGRSESFATPALICYKCISVYFCVLLHTCISTLICRPRLLAPLTYTPPHPHIFVFSQVVFDFDTVFVVLWICLHACKMICTEVVFCCSLSILSSPSLSLTNSSATTLPPAPAQRRSTAALIRCRADAFWDSFCAFGDVVYSCIGGAL